MYNNLLKLLAFVVCVFVFLRIVCVCECVCFVDVSLLFLLFFLLDMMMCIQRVFDAFMPLAACLSRCLLAICFGVCSSLSVPNFSCFS